MIVAGTRRLDASRWACTATTAAIVAATGRAVSFVPTAIPAATPARTSRVARRWSLAAASQARRKYVDVSRSPATMTSVYGTLDCARTIGVTANSDPATIAALRP